MELFVLCRLHVTLTCLTLSQCALITDIGVIIAVRGMLPDITFFTTNNQFDKQVAFLNAFYPITVGSHGSSHSCRGGGGNFFPTVKNASKFNKCLYNCKVIDEIRHM